MTRILVTAVVLTLAATMSTLAAPKQKSDPKPGAAERTHEFCLNLARSRGGGKAVNTNATGPGLYGKCRRAANPIGAAGFAGLTPRTLCTAPAMRQNKP